MKSRLFLFDNPKGYAFLNPWWGRMLLVLLLWSSWAPAAWGQTKEWDKTYGGSHNDALTVVKPTSDGGYILGGSSLSGDNGDKSHANQGICDASFCTSDYWVIKLDSAGNKVWDKTFGGDRNDFLTGLVQTSAGEYLLGGYSSSDISGDKTGRSQGSYDYWVLKLDSAGIKIWDKTLGGTEADALMDLQATSDGGAILGGHSPSPRSKDKSESSKGNVDYWIVKLDSAGQKEWDKTIGGNERDLLTALYVTSDKGYVLGGYSSSGISADKSEAIRGSFDYWVVKVDSVGNKEWDKTYGGSKTDILAALAQTRDGGYIVGGYSPSGESGDKTDGGRGNNDYWVLKLHADGSKAWDKTLGGRDQDLLTSLQQTREGGYVLGGSSDSDISGDKSQGSLGEADQWVVKLDANGNKIWDRTFGGGTIDGLSSLHQTDDGGYLLGGSSSSDVGGDKSQPTQGGADYWIVKIRGDLVALPPHFSAFTPRKDIPGTIVTITGRNLASLTAVLFNGLESEFEIINDRLVKAKVPAAATSGKVSLVSPGGTVHSNGSFWIRQPAITAFVPIRGRAGSTVLLVGERLTTVKEVSFDNVPAQDFTVYFDWAMTVVIPEGATSGKIRVLLEGGGKGTSKSAFTIAASAVPQVIVSGQGAREEMPELEIRPLTREEPRIGAYPNPFSQQVTFSFTLAQQQPVIVKVYDVLGRELSLLYQGEAQARQAYQLEWRPAAQLPGGLYIIRLQAPNQVIQKRVVLTR